jgi:hypothetical protein
MPKKGWTHTPESRKRMREAALKRWEREGERGAQSGRSQIATAKRREAAQETEEPCLTYTGDDPVTFTADEYRTLLRLLSPIWRKLARHGYL